MKLLASILMSLLCVSMAFHVQPRSSKVLAFSQSSVGTTSSLYGFLGDKERESLTRDSEPEEFFAT